MAKRSWRTRRGSCSYLDIRCSEINSLKIKFTFQNSYETLINILACYNVVILGN